MHDDPPQKLSVAFLIEVALAGMCVFAVAITISLTADSGTTADWVAAISTFATFVAATIAGWFAYHALLVERRRDKHRNDTERRAQASKVGAWGDNATRALHTSYGHPTPDDVGPTLPDVLRATIRNTSDLPVHEFWLQFYLRSTDDTTWDLVGEHEAGRVLPYDPAELGHTVNLLPQLNVNGVIMNDPDHPFYLRLVAEFEERGMPSGLNVGSAFGWSFLDNNNVHWVRVPEQELREGPRPVLGPHRPAAAG